MFDKCNTNTSVHVEIHFSHPQLQNNKNGDYDDLVFFFNISFFNNFYNNYFNIFGF